MTARQGQKGQVIVLFALMLIVLLLAADLAIDGSFGWVQQRQAQNAADFAAIAGANSLRDGVNDASVLAAIDKVAQANNATVSRAEYTDYSGKTYNPSKSVGQQPDLTAFGGVKVVALRTWTPIIPSLWGNGLAEASASGTARFTQANSGGSGPCALCALSSTYPALDIGSGGAITIAEGSVLSDGGLRATSGGAMHLTGTGAAISVYGTSNIGAGSVSPALTPLDTPISDPYFFLTDPVASGTSRAAVSQSDKGIPTTIDPGVYPSISVGSGAALTLSPGTYYISGTGVTCGSGSTLTALGVTMVFLGHASFAPSSGCTLNLSAPAPTLTPSTTTPYPGMLIYFARTNNTSLTLGAGSGTTISGSVYAKTGTLTVQGGSATGTVVKSMIVVANIQVKANSYLTTSYASSLNVILPATEGTVSLVQ